MTRKVTDPDQLTDIQAGAERRCHAHILVVDRLARNLTGRDREGGLSRPCDRSVAGPALSAALVRGAPSNGRPCRNRYPRWSRESPRCAPPLLGNHWFARLSAGGKRV